MSRKLSAPDRLLSALEQSFRTLAAPAAPRRPSPGDAEPEAMLTARERRDSIALMRVNHAGEIAAQALYVGQAGVARSDATRRCLLQAADEERDHLAWCAQRLAELDGRESLLTPLWFAGGLLTGALAGSIADELSLGFVAETERQVEAHLENHLSRLPSADLKSAAILAQMTDDEARHGATAERAGARALPYPIRRAMAVGGEVLRKVAAIV